jgi:hypothetical protein
MVRTFLLILALSLAACSGPSPDRMLVGRPVGSFNPLLKDAIGIGQISGGSSFVIGQIANRITDEQFREALRYSLDASDLLAPDLTAARWRLDIELRVNSVADGWTPETTIKYRLIDHAAGKQVFETTIKTVQPLAGGSQVVSVGVARSLQKDALAETVRRNLQQFLAEVSAWGRDVAPKISQSAQ